MPSRNDPAQGGDKTVATNPPLTPAAAAELEYPVGSLGPGRRLSRFRRNLLTVAVNC